MASTMDSAAARARSLSTHEPNHRSRHRRAEAMKSWTGPRATKSTCLCCIGRPPCRTRATIWKVCGTTAGARSGGPALDSSLPIPGGRPDLQMGVTLLPDRSGLRVFPMHFTPRIDPPQGGFKPLSTRIDPPANWFQTTSCPDRSARQLVSNHFPPGSIRPRSGFEPPSTRIDPPRTWFYWNFWAPPPTCPTFAIRLPAASRRPPLSAPRRPARAPSRGGPRPSRPGGAPRR